jgi:hypothetical protein
MVLDLIISVVLYNNCESQINTIIDSCQGSALKLKLVFVDNAAPNQKFLFQNCPAWVSYQPMATNVGFGSAHNEVILGKDKARYYLILNPDVEFKASILDEISSYLDEHPQVSLLMPRVIWPNGKDQGLRKLLPSPADLLLRRFIPSSLKPFFKGREEQYQLQNFDANFPMIVPVLSGCFMFCPHQVLIDEGGFDPDFFLYLEDVDLSRRLFQRGQNLYWPKVNIIHHYQKGSYRSLKPLILHLKSAWKYFNKHGWFIDDTRREINHACLLQDQNIHL